MTILYVCFYLLIGFLLGIFHCTNSRARDEFESGLVGISFLFLWPIILFFSIIITLVALLGTILEFLAGKINRWR